MFESNIETTKMASRGLSVSKVLRFFGRLWLMWFKAALCVSLLSVVVSVFQVAVSQEVEEDYMYPDYGSGDMFDNNTNCTASNASTSCTDLPANELCLKCSFDFNCAYGKNTTVQCTVVGDVECTVCRL